MAQTVYTWGSATTGGSWWTSGDWKINGNSVGGFPGATDTADLANATANRVIIYGVQAGGEVGALNFTQTTANVTNELDLQSSLQVSSPLTVSATQGTSEILLDSPATGIAPVELTSQNGLTIGLGGNVTISGYSSLLNSSNEGGGMVGPVTINGGTLAVNKGLSGGTTYFGVTQNLNLESGSITFGGGSGTSTDNHFVVEGNFSMSGGSIASNGAGSLDLDAATNTITGGTLNGTTLHLNSSTGQSLTSSVALGDVTVAGNEGNVTTISDGASGINIGAITLVAPSNAMQPNFGAQLNLGSSLQASGQLTAGTATSGFVSETVNLNGHLLDLSGAGGNFAPNQAGSASTSWTIESTNGAGSVKAQGFTLSGASSTSIGSNVNLYATGAVANDLGGSGTIDPSSGFIYEGTGTATLISNRTIGNIQVNYGTLQVNQAQLSMAGGLDVINGGTFDLNGTAVGTLALGYDGYVLVQNGTLVLTLGTAFDQIQNGGGFGSFNFSNLTLSINQGAGFSTSNSYDILSGFADGVGIDNVATNVAGYNADISSAGVLTFVPAPEPSAWRLLMGGLLFASAAWRRRWALV